MDATRLREVEDIYQAAAENAPADRNAFIRARCGDDDDLRREVESLLSYEDISDSFIDSSADAIAADMFADQISTDVIGTTVGHYRIQRLLGEGGMGKVYLADDTLLGRKVALKILPPTLIEHPDRLKRFKQEARAASALNHPNILTIHEFGADKDSDYIVTEYVDGITLRQKMRGGVSLKETLEIASQAASALAAAHSAGIIHRDIKPDNIMIRRDGFLKVLDFGLAKLSMPPEPAGQNLEAATMFRTEPGMVMGTPNYMSPEQARGIKVDARTDIWSLGVIIYEMITGTMPFAGPTQTDILVAILNQPVPPIDRFIADAPAELKRIVDKSLAKDADERYQNMDELASELKRLHHRLEFEAELEQTHGSAHTTDEQGEARETATRMMPAATADAPSLGPDEHAGAASGRASGNRSLRVLGAMAVLAGLAAVISVIVWRSSGTDAAREQLSTQAAPPAAPAAQPPQVLAYSLTVQSFSDGRYKEAFRLSGEMLFRNRDRIRINIKSPQGGYLYILNQGPQSESGVAAYNILFPSPTTNGGTAQLSAGQEIQIPQQSWFELDAKEGTELVWLVWSAYALPDLESAKQFANPEDRGRIKDAGLVKSIETLLQEHGSAANAKRDDDKKESAIAANADIVTHLIKLEHH